MYRALIGKPEGNRPLGGPRRRWEDNTALLKKDGLISYVQTYEIESIFLNHALFRWIFRKWDVGVWTGFSWQRMGTGGEHL
jgi:hypothetical protein